MQKITTIFILLFLTLLSVSCVSSGSDSEVSALTETNSALVEVITTDDASVEEDSEGENGRSQTTTSDTTTDTARPSNWTAETHSNDADLNYEIVFPEDEVNRIDITIDPDQWQSLQDNMTDLYGEFGTSSDRMGGRPTGNNPTAGGNPPAGNNPPAGGNPPGGGNPPAQDQQGQGEAPPQDAQGQRGGGPGLEAENANPDWIPVTIEFEGATWTDVGFRYKGNSSLRSTWSNGEEKMPFKLDFDEFEDSNPSIDNQRFYGFKQLSFSSNYNDDTFLHETIAYDVFDEMGIPTSETAFYEVYVDYGEGSVYYGLYTMIEVVDDTVIETDFADDNGNVYKPDGYGASFAAGTFNEDDFDKETNADEADWSDILALYDVLESDLRTTDAAAWRTELEAIFDVDIFLRWLAANSVMQNWDTYGTAYHNYYLYNNPETGQLTWIPWDNNEALQQNRMGFDDISHENTSAEWPLIRFLLDDTVYHAQYVAYVEEVITTAFEQTTTITNIQELANLIRPYISQELSEGMFDSAIEKLINHIHERND
ncbi:MAG: hypothetical protein DWQ04_32520, partial [Chloroflexi bacterium]